MSFSSTDLASALDTTTLSTIDSHAVALMACVVHSPESAVMAVEELHSRGADTVLVAEILLQSTLFAGFPRALNALHAHRELFGESDLSPRVLEPSDLHLFRERGETFFRDIYREHSDKVLTLLDSYHPELRDWILVSAYGRVLARDGVAASTRELAACAALMVSRDLRQLASHARGARHLGASESELAQVGRLVSRLTDRPEPAELG